VNFIYLETANREQDFEEKAGAFEYHTGKMVDSAEQTAIHGKHATKQLVDNIHTATKEVIAQLMSIPSQWEKAPKNSLKECVFC